MKHEAIAKLLTEIITGICAYREDLDIQPVEHGKMAHRLIVRPHMADYSKLVGKKGGTIKALQIVAETAGHHAGISFELNLVETEVGTPEPRQRNYTQTFDLAKLERLVRETAEWVFARPVEIKTREDHDRIQIQIDAPRDEISQALMLHLARIFYPYGKANGRTVEIRQL